MFWISDEKSGYKDMDGSWPEEDEMVAGMWLVTAAQKEDLSEKDSWQITVGKGQREEKKWRTSKYRRWMTAEEFEQNSWRDDHARLLKHLEASCSDMLVAVDEMPGAAKKRPGEDVGRREKKLKWK